MTYYIYTLAHPITKEIRYIGKTNNLQKRYYGHLNDKRKSPRCSWVKSLKTKDLYPLMEVLEEFDNEEFCYQREIYWIAQFKEWGFNLTNLLAGGEGLHTGENIGIKNKNCRTNEVTILIIADLLKNSDLTDKEIAEQTNTTVYIVRSVKYGDSWSHITGITTLSSGNKGSGKSRKRSSEKRVQALRDNGTYDKLSIPIEQYTLENIFIQDFKSISEASDKTNTDRTSITQCINNKQLTANNFIWKRKLK